MSPVTHGSNPPSAEVLVTESRPSRGRGRGNNHLILAQICRPQTAQSAAPGGDNVPENPYLGGMDLASRVIYIWTKLGYREKSFFHPWCGLFSRISDPLRRGTIDTQSNRLEIPAEVFESITPGGESELSFSRK